MRAIDADELLKVTVKKNGIWNAITNSSGEGLEEIINNQPTIEIPKWIPVSERLPEDEVTVMVSCGKCVFPEARYSETRGWEWAYESGSDYWEELYDVNAWMPLPEPYKEGE